MKRGHLADKLHPNHTIFIMPNNIHPSESSKMGSYGSFIVPEQSTVGLYRLQTDFPPLLKYMKKRDWDAKSPWRTVGWGTSYIFHREFSGTYEAKRSIKRIFAKIGYPDIEFKKLQLGGFEIVRGTGPIAKPSSHSEKPFKSANWQKTPPLSGKKRRPDPYFPNSQNNKRISQ